MNLLADKPTNEKSRKGSTRDAVEGSVGSKVLGSREFNGDVVADGHTANSDSKFVFLGVVTDDNAVIA